MHNTLSRLLIAGALLPLASWVTHAATYHVATNGNDTARGTKAAPLRTIQRAADLAQPGDTITVHQGVYRERINPPRGGTSEKSRITYQAAPGERVEIKGSETVRGWEKVKEGVWKATLPNSFFGKFNPYNDLIHGDWFDPRGRPHHTGAVYLNGDWLTEAAKLEEVLNPDVTPAWLNQGGGQYLLNVAWFAPAGKSGEGARIPAARMAAQQGVQTAACTEGGECIGWIDAGDWARYDNVSIDQLGGEVDLRVASATQGGVVELRLGEPNGELLGSCKVPNTGGWQAWVSVKAKLKPASAVKPLCLAFKSLQTDPAAPSPLNPQLWFAQVDAANTTIWAQFKGVNPNEQLVEINVRQSVFYPDQPGRNFITVRGFGLHHAATPWAPPTAEQIGLIGTHWSKGWIIENNTVSYSTSSGIALGKHGDQFDNTSADTAEGYVKTIERAHAFRIPWTRENIGHHIVRNNTVSHCEQAGIVGSLGAAFSTVTGNTIHDIHVRRLFSGAEMAGIKFHAAIDSVISGNHIHHTCRGLWLDWMAQGTHVSANLFHDNADQDLFVEVDHGPFLVDNNLFLSAMSLLDVSEGGAYAHNLFAGKIVSQPEPSRDTPYHPAHSTTVAGLVKIKGGDDRFYNNLFMGTGTAVNDPAKDPQWAGGHGLWVYDFREMPLYTGGNAFYHGARPYAKEAKPVAQAGGDPQWRLTKQDGRFVLQLTLGPELTQGSTPLVTTELLGKAKIPGLPYENADGSPLKVNTDFFGKKRSKTNPTPGPFEKPGTGAITLQLR